VRSQQPSQVRLALDVVRARREGPAGLARRRDARFAALVDHARRRSAFYRERYAALPLGSRLPAAERTRVAASFGAALHEAYAASELGDSGLPHRPDPCLCGSPLPAVRVQGRRDDVLVLRTSRGDPVKVAPLALVAVVDQGRGVRRSQIVQTGPRSRLVRLDTRQGVDPSQVRAHVAEAITRNLTDRGLSGVELTFAPDAPRPEPSGKFRQVVRLAADQEDRGGQGP
jgi:hypothetical protein